MPKRSINDTVVLAAAGVYVPASRVSESSERDITPRRARGSGGRRQSARPRVRPARLPPLSLEETVERARGCYDEMSRRRTTRHFSREAVPREAIEYAIRTAGTAVWK